jgi:two-component system sensor kinase FixL
MERRSTAFVASEERLRVVENDFAHFVRMVELGEMAAAMAHEINQALTAIANYLNAACLPVNEPTGEALAHARRAMELAAEQGRRAAAIIRGLREFARKGDGVRKVAGADALVRSAMALALVDADAVKIRIERQSAGPDATIEVDPVQIEQVLVNLIRNAVDALAAKPPWIERRLYVIARDLAEEGVVSIRIADNGPGVLPQLLDRLFEPFVTSKAHGLGMGLSVSRIIVEAHGGTIEVESEPGAGAAFTVRLPRRADASACPEAGAA